MQVAVEMFWNNRTTPECPAAPPPGGLIAVTLSCAPVQAMTAGAEVVVVDFVVGGFVAGLVDGPLLVALVDSAAELVGALPRPDVDDVQATSPPEIVRAITATINRDEVMMPILALAGESRQRTIRGPPANPRPAFAITFGMDSSDRVALVTGANKGIGRHIAHQLAQAGVTVYLGSRDHERGARTVAELAEAGVTVRAVALEVTDQSSIEAAVAQIDAEAGRLDSLVNNAGMTSGRDSASEVILDDLRRTYETNVLGVVAVTNAFLPLLRRSGSPRIVNISSGMGLAKFAREGMFGPRNLAAYQSSKAALNMLTVLYATELAAEGFLVNAVSPGYRATDLNGGNTMPGAGDAAGGAVVAVHAALFGADGPNGVFLSDTGQTYDW